MEKSEEALLFYLGENYLEVLKIEVPDSNWKYLTRQLAYPYEYFNSLDDYQKPVDNLKKEDCFSKLKIDYQSDEEIERTEEIIILFNIKNGEELTRLYLKSHVFFTYVCF